jgi:hypothetical protein
MSFKLSLFLFVLSIFAFGVFVNIWHYPNDPPKWLVLPTYLSFMWPFVTLMKFLPKSECNGSSDYDSCGANDWAYILFLPILLISHSALFYWILSIANKRQSES